jgi:hypothetical protein
LVDNKCPNFEQHFIKMCLNCASCDTRCDDDGSEKYLCANETHMENALNKIKETLNGYEIEDIKLKPLPLKDFTKKCKLWKLNGLRISEQLEQNL